MKLIINYKSQDGIQNANQCYNCLDKEIHQVENLDLKSSKRVFS